MSDERKSPGEPRSSTPRGPRSSPRRRPERGPQTDGRSGRRSEGRGSPGPRPKPRGHSSDQGPSDFRNRARRPSDEDGNSSSRPERPDAKPWDGKTKNQFEDKRDRPPRKTVEKEERAKAPQVNKVRTEFGTRVARRINCNSCGKSDTIDFVPKDGSNILCRKCAYEKYNVHDPDQQALSEYTYKCASCSIEFKSRLFFENEDEIKCSNCYMGIETKQEDKVKRGKTVKKGVIRVKRKPTEE